MCLSEFLKVDALISLDRDQVVVPFLIVPDKKVLCITVRIRELDRVR